MPRRLLSLLALLLLVLAAQAVADRGGDGKRGGDSRDDRDDGDDRDGEREGDDGRDDGDDGKDDDGRDGKKEDGRDRESRKEDAGRRDPDRKGGGEGDRPRRLAEPSVPAVRDAGLEVLPTVLPGRIQFSFLTTAATSLDQVLLTAELPPAGAWRLSGPGSESCDLDGLRLRCAFGGLAAGEVQLVQVAAAVDRAPPWEIVAQASVAAGGGADAVPGNDAAAGRIGLLLA